MDEIVCGAKGGGKTKYVITKIYKALRKKKVIATNIDIDIAYLPLKSIKTKKFDGLLIRLPDVPRATDFFSLGMGYNGDKIDDARNGSIIIDEASLTFSSYDFMSKDLQERFDYLINSRKFRWNVFYLVHDIKTLASRIRRSFGNDVVTRCNSIYSLFNIEQESFLRRIIPNIHISRTRKATQGEEIKGGFTKPTIFKASYLEQAYDTEQKYSTPMPILAPFQNLNHLQLDESYIFPYHPLTKDKAPKGFKYVDISAPYTCLPPRLTGKEIKRNRVKEFISLGIMFFFFLLGILWLFRGDEEEPKKSVSTHQESNQKPISTNQNKISTNSDKECNFLDSLKFIPKSEMFSDNWFLQLMAQYKPVAKDFSYQRGTPTIYQSLDFNLLFFNNEDTLVASTNAVELESFGWHSFRWSRGVFFVQKTYWANSESNTMNRREIYFFLQSDVVPPTFQEAVSNLKGGRSDNMFSGVVSTALGGDN